MTNNKCKILHRLESVKAMLDHQIKSIREDEKFPYSFINAVNCSHGYLEEVEELWKEKMEDKK